MKNFKIYGLFAVSILMLSCNKDKEIEIYEINDASFLVLETEKGLRNQELSLMLKGSNEEDYTELATFYVNENPIDGNTFSSSSEGMFEVYAQYNLAGIQASTPFFSPNVSCSSKIILVHGVDGVLGWQLLCMKQWI